MEQSILYLTSLLHSILSAHQINKTIFVQGETPLFRLGIAILDSQGREEIEAAELAVSTESNQSCIAGTFLPRQDALLYVII